MDFDGMRRSYDQYSDEDRRSVEERHTPCCQYIKAGEDSQCAEYRRAEPAEGGARKGRRTGRKSGSGFCARVRAAGRTGGQAGSEPGT